jgi:hypothetical protein
MYRGIGMKMRNQCSGPFSECIIPPPPPTTLEPGTTVPDSKSRNIPEVVIVRRGAGGVLGICGEWVSWVKGGANGVSLQAT